MTPPWLHDDVAIREETEGRISHGMVERITPRRVFLTDHRWFDLDTLTRKVGSHLYRLVDPTDPSVAGEVRAQRVKRWIEELDSLAVDLTPESDLSGVRRLALFLAAEAS